MQRHEAVLPFEVFLSQCTAIIDSLIVTSSDRLERERALMNE